MKRPSQEILTTDCHPFMEALKLAQSHKPKGCINVLLDDNEIKVYGEVCAPAFTPSTVAHAPIIRNQSSQSVTLQNGLFSYDLAKRFLFITSSKDLCAVVPWRFAMVISRLLQKEAGNQISCLDHFEIAKFFEIGRWKQEKSKLTDDELDIRFQKSEERIERLKLDLAYEFNREFSRWARGKKIDPNTLVASERGYGYKLGPGWHPTRKVIGGSEICTKPVGKEIEQYCAPKASGNQYDEDPNTTSQNAEDKDENWDPQGYGD
jgi:hypothetical protein